MSNWIQCTERLPDEGVVVETKIDDADGCQNEKTLVRKGRLWFVDINLSSYVYYMPTHWRYSNATNSD